MTGRELKIKRVAAGLTQWDIAKQLNLQPTRISEMERGQRPVAEAVIQVVEKALADELDGCELVGVEGLGG